MRVTSTAEGRNWLTKSSARGTGAGATILGPALSDPIRADEDAERAAALAICARARDKADAIHLLQVCGLLSAPPAPPRGLTGKPRCPRCGRIRARCTCPKESPQ
jgi:hypothetical protein